MTRLSATPATELEFAGNDRFEVLARIGAGGMGVVYKAHDRDRNARIALKTLRTLSGEGVLRFKNEFRALQDLQHPNLVNLGELISDGGQWFFTMELVEGVDFLTWVRPVLGFEPPGDFALAGDELRHDATTLPPDGGKIAYEARATDAMKPELDEARLRIALKQLGRGLTALHAAGKVHRDIKPSNVLVTRESRVVLLDFGLATEVGGHGQSEVNVVGTADYMAPEQAASRSVGPAADWYSLGVVLYEALTGRLPFSGAPLEVLIAKQRGEPPAVATIAPGVPADLAGLCDALLLRDPAARPSGGTVMRALGADEPDELRTQTASHTPFVGRGREFNHLKAAFADSRDGTPVTVLVQGESGVGKSALVRQFLERLREDVRGVVVLAGRCYERESVPYKALDGVIDSLARWMMRLPQAEASSLLPLRANLLAQVFPVLQRVDAVLKAPGNVPGLPRPIDPIEQRRRTFAALRELFVRAAAQHPLAIAIDDLQWADGDSLSLLSEILQPPDAPSLLLIATLRPVDHALNLTGALTGDVRQLALDRLSPDESRQLVTLLAERTEAGHLSADSTRAIADEARGHPLFIDELVRHATSEGELGERRETLHLEDALWARVRRLDGGERRLLELVTVAGGPLPLQAAARALAGSDDADPAEVTRHASLLRGGNLVRSSGGTDEALEPYHDRVRAAVRAHIDDDGLRDMHRRLALALEQTGADAEALSIHFRGAGELGRAAQYADLAANQAAQALAFERAAALYRVALQLDPEGKATRERQIGLGEALATLGRCGDAALCFLIAAKLASSGESLELQRRASEQLLISGHIDEGLVGLRTVLEHFKLELASTPRRALLSLLMRRARVRLRGLRYKERPESDIPVEKLRRIDVCWSVAMGLAMVDTIRGADFQTRHLLYALEAGEPYRIARALAMESAFVSATGKSPERAAQLLAAGSALAERTGSAHGIGMCELAAGVGAYLRGEWKKAHDRCQDALEILREHCTNVPWEINTANQFSMLSLARMGHIAEMTKQMPQLRRSARERGDLYQTVVLRAGMMCLPALASDEPARVREDLQEAFSRWSRQGFQMQHYWEVYSKAYVDLYENDGRTALDRVTARWPVLEKSLILETEYVRCEAIHLRALTLLATATRHLHGSTERDALIKQAERDTRDLLRGAPWAQALGKLLEAGISAVRGQTARAISLTDQAISAFEATDMYLMGAVARRRRGELEGGPSGEALVAAADAWMLEQKIKAPRRMCSVFAPGFPD